jgi:hypothetical protein
MGFFGVEAAGVGPPQLAGSFISVDLVSVVQFPIFPRCPSCSMMRNARVATMPIYRLLQNSPLGPEEISILTDAYERTLRELSLVDRNDPTDRKVIDLARRA